MLQGYDRCLGLDSSLLSSFSNLRSDANIFPFSCVFGGDRPDNPLNGLLEVKLVFYPLSAASYRSMAKMKQVAPRLKALKEKFGDDRQKMNTAMMEMYRTEKINPLGGCLPVVVQIPVFISLYWVLLASVEMRGAPWVLWVDDLSARDPLFLLPAIMMATMFLQIKLNPTPPDPMQAKVMMLMPLVFGGMMFFFPAGLVLYWCVNNIISIAQQWYITKKMAKVAAEPHR